jgi:hypothetical protein
MTIANSNQIAQTIFSGLIDNMTVQQIMKNIQALNPSLMVNIKRSPRISPRRRNRRTPKRTVESEKEEEVVVKSTKRRSPKRKSPKRLSPKRQSPKRK